MSFAAKVLCDSVHWKSGVRLTTLEVVYPRMVHSEDLRHRMKSCNVASSRAIPVQKILNEVCENPVIPIHWGAAQKGMQAFNEVPPDTQEKARRIVLRLRDQAVAAAEELLELGLHKQVINRYLEPWMWCTVLATATDRCWRHFDSLRRHVDAEPHIRRIADIAAQAREQSTPVVLQDGQWHLPLFGFDGDEQITDPWQQVKVSAGRCARVSYKTHDGRRDVQADIDLADRLVADRHYSPTEHQAMVVDPSEVIISNFSGGWKQYRKFLPGEYTE